MIYTIDGSEISEAYDINGLSLSSVYDINGTEIPLGGSPDIPVTPMSWNLSAAFKTQVLAALSNIEAYQAENPGSYSIVQFNDVHQIMNGNEPNFLDYNKGYKVYSRMLFLGDLADSSSSTQYTNSVNYMAGAQAAKRIVAMGNHEYMSYNSSYGDPEALYKALINVPATYMYPNNSFLIYYSDDYVNNVRYIILDYFYINKSGHDSRHLLDLNQLNWCASALESACQKDIIMAAHSMFNPFYRLYNGTSTSSSAQLQNQDKLCDLINAYKARGTYSVTIDNVQHTHSFAACTGKFIFYTSGHYHIAGHSSDFGFNMFTCAARKGASNGTEKGFTFFLIDPAKSFIRMYECDTTKNNYLIYEFDY